MSDDRMDQLGTASALLADVVFRMSGVRFTATGYVFRIKLPFDAA